MALLRPPFRRVADAAFEVSLPAPLRTLLGGLPAQMRELLADDGPGLVRLFPPTYRDDPEKEAEYRRLMRDELVASRLASAEVLERTAGQERLTSDELAAWMRAVNDVRLVLGTTLDVSEESGAPSDGPEAEAYELYELLGWLLHHIVEALDG